MRMNLESNIDLPAEAVERAQTAVGAEQEIACRLAAVLRDHPEFNTIQLYVSKAARTRMPYFHFTLHGPDLCESACDLGKLLAESKKQLMGNPEGKAEEKRRQARGLIEEAEQLEAIAAGNKEAV